jgi:shikimate 5-dehydrogenase
VNFEIVKLDNLSGRKANIYSIMIDDESKSLFGKFITKYKIDFKDEVIDIVDRIDLIANYTGAENRHFKENEGRLGDLVCALYDMPNSNLRLYCIRLGKTVLILGGGGFKSKLIRALQQDSTLTEENYLMREISEKLYERIKEKEIYWSDDEMEILGNLIFEDNE